MDPGHVVLEVWISDEGSLLRVERAIPSGATEADIERVTSDFFGEVVKSMPEHTGFVFDALEEQLGAR